jgi:hypothetical protein
MVSLEWILLALIGVIVSLVAVLYWWSRSNSFSITPSTKSPFGYILSNHAIAEIVSGREHVIVVYAQDGKIIKTAKARIPVSENGLGYET